ncbi:hypothetical protein BC937DRAFT_90700 [Endogone sp. FLAS-F59071]|nr:hypothetical protein BC937DRAFT_90700 [Endogone sp. FLAS-F59071]|eukprot:RUS16874.1 hypothetical protein BC937DRAFT_90700 [Endogone sp. FLAS-F59071]
MVVPNNFGRSTPSVMIQLSTPQQGEWLWNILNPRDFCLMYVFVRNGLSHIVPTDFYFVFAWQDFDRGILSVILYLFEINYNCLGFNMFVVSCLVKAGLGWAECPAGFGFHVLASFKFAIMASGKKA